MSDYKQIQYEASILPTFFLSHSFQNKLDKMQIGSSEDVNNLNYDYDN